MTVFAINIQAESWTEWELLFCLFGLWVGLGCDNIGGLYTAMIAERDL